MESFTQVLDPLNSVAGSALLALVPVAVLLVLLAVFRVNAWRAVIIGSAVTLILAVTVWNAPVGNSLAAYGLGQQWSQTVIFLILITLMVFKPEGILGRRTTEKV